MRSDKKASSAEVRRRHAALSPSHDQPGVQTTRPCIRGCAAFGCSFTPARWPPCSRYRGRGSDWPCWLSMPSAGRMDLVEDFASDCPSRSFATCWACHSAALALPPLIAGHPGSAGNGRRPRATGGRQRGRAEFSAYLDDLVSEPAQAAGGRSATCWHSDFTAKVDGERLSMTSWWQNCIFL